MSAGSPKRFMGVRARIFCCAFGIAGQGFAEHGGFDPAGGDGVDADALAGDFGGEGANHADVGRLGGGVGDHLRNPKSEAMDAVKRMLP